jgi:hypothetical protein
LRVILHNVTQRRVYHQVLATEGNMRHNLAGEPVEPVSPEHRAAARDALEKLKQKAKIKRRPDMSDEDPYERYAAFAEEKIERLIEVRTIGPILQGIINRLAREKAAKPPAT